MLQYAKEIYSFDLGKTVDRTQQDHSLGSYDVDFKKGETWVYGFSCKTTKKAIKGANDLTNKLKVETRIVNSLTGEVLHI
jgi:hypothetical protein